VVNAAVRAVLAAGLICAACVAACARSPSGAAVDRDRDGLDDRLEDELAAHHLPSIHEFGEVGGLAEECGAPYPRPVLFRARPRPDSQDSSPREVAITYVLLYADDCGGLGHPGDSESFTVFVHLDPVSHVWRVAGVSAVAHLGTPAERRTVGSGDAIWVSRNKHAPFATFESCEDGDIVNDQCRLDGPPPSGVVLLNVGEPSAPLSDDLGDVIALVGSRGAHSSASLSIFRGRKIWSRARTVDGDAPLLDVAPQFFINRATYDLPPGVTWPDEAEIPVSSLRSR
jgi:hypothetical protein